MFLIYWKYDHEVSSRIRIFFSIPDLGIKKAQKAPDPGYRFATLLKQSSPQHFERTSCPAIIYGAKKEKNLRIQNKKAAAI
jgi:hypothetical protein